VNLWNFSFQTQEWK